MAQERAPAYLRSRKAILRQRSMYRKAKRSGNQLHGQEAYVDVARVQNDHGGTSMKRASIREIESLLKLSN